MTLATILDLLMFATLCLAILLGFPVAFTLAGVSLLFAFLASALGVFDLNILAAFPQRIWGIMQNGVLLAIPLFIFMGLMLERSRIAEALLEVMGRAMGRLRGGLGLSVIVVGALMAASTGIIGATVVTMGLLSLPTMLRHGYAPPLASGLIVASGSLGQIIPPSIVLILLGEVMANAYQQSQLAQGIFSPETITVSDLFAGALLPGLLLVVAYAVYLLIRAFLDPSCAPALPASARARVTLAEVSTALVPPLVLILAVLGSIIFGIATTTEAAAVGALGAILLAGRQLRPERQWPVLLGGLAIVALLVLSAITDIRITRSVITPGEQAVIALAVVLSAVVAWAVIASLGVALRRGVLREAVEGTARLTAMVFMILIGATLFTVVFRGLGGDETVRALLEGVPGGVTGAILAVMLAMFILGFFLDFIEITLVIVPVVAPVLLMMGVDPIWLAIMMSVNLQTSFLTPPFGFALFYLRGVAPRSLPTLAIYRGALPFILLQLMMLALLWWAPALVTWLPEYLLG